MADPYVVCLDDSTLGPTLFLEGWPTILPIGFPGGCTSVLWVFCQVGFGVRFCVRFAFLRWWIDWNLSVACLLAWWDGLPLLVVEQLRQALSAFKSLTLRRFDASTFRGLPAPRRFNVAR